MIQTTVPAPVAPSRRRWAVVAVCGFALFLVGVDTTIVTIGLGEIGGALGVGADRLSWVVDAYTVVFAALLITSGALADRVGRRRVFTTGLVVFGIASLACASAPTLGVLITARAVQGVGASMLTPVALAIVVNVMTDPRERATAIGIWGAIFGLSMAAGPVTGGVLISSFDWRAVFWINVPVVLLALVLVALVVPESRGQHIRRIDAPGQALLIVLLVVAVGLLIEGPRTGWTASAALVGYGVLAVTLAAFIAIESGRREPLIEPALFRRASFTGAVVGAFVVFVAFSMTLLMTTQLLQGAEGWTPTAAGVATLPMAVGATLFAPLSGYLVGRTGPRLPLVLAGVLLSAGGLCLASLAAGMNLAVLLIAYLLVGAGVAFANAPITHTAIIGLPPDRAGVAGGITSTARQGGTAAGIALAGSLLAASGSAGFAASLTGWLIIACCGVILLVIAATATRTSLDAQWAPDGLSSPAGGGR